MQKVNEEKLLHDHAELVAKREENLAEVEADAREYAANHGYSEDKTEQFVAFTKELEGDGLSTDEKAKLELLASYIEEVEDFAEEAGSDEGAPSEEAEPAPATASTFVI